ncbi:MAG: CRISPR-associated endoribonuclease Cas6 [Syntrophomonadaceae bacterium]|nr:CRISPR-associated endoribonuclease Cas6 [Syntrophomonadaceae bacterium]
MLRQIKIKLKIDKGTYPKHYWAYNLYSILQEMLPPDYASYLHQDGINPINNYLIIPPRKYLEEQGATWVINVWGEKAIEHVLIALNKIRYLEIKSYDTRVEVEGINSGKLIKEKDFVREHLTQSNPPNWYRLILLSPTSFRSNNEYTLFPSSELIIKSAVQKWNAYAQETIINDEQALEDLIKNSRIVDYSLKSCRYRFKGVKIPAFMGSVIISLRGPHAMLNLYNMLLNFLPYSGLGIKASLGMGAVRVEEGDNGKQNN